HERPAGVLPGLPHREPRADAPALTTRLRRRAALALGVEQLDQAAAHVPQLGDLALGDQLSQHLDRRALGPDRVLAERAGDDRVVAEAPHPDALVPVGQELGQLVELLVLAAALVELRERE